MRCNMVKERPREYEKYERIALEICEEDRGSTDIRTYIEFPPPTKKPQELKIRPMKSSKNILI